MVWFTLHSRGENRFRCGHKACTHKIFFWTILVCCWHPLDGIFKSLKQRDEKSLKLPHLSCVAGGQCSVTSQTTQSTTLKDGHSAATSFSIVGSLSTLCSLEIELSSAVSFCFFHIQSSREEKQETHLSETASLLLFFFSSRSAYVKSEILTGIGQCGWINVEETLLVSLLCIKTSSVPKDLRALAQDVGQTQFCPGPSQNTCSL